MHAHLCAIISLSLLLVACDGLVGPLDVPFSGADLGGEIDLGDDASMGDVDAGEPEPIWDSQACGEEEAICDREEVCLAGLCGELVGMEAGPSTVCAVHQINGGEESIFQTVCWGTTTGILDPAGSLPAEFGGWRSIPEAIERGEEFLDLAVSESYACVLVSNNTSPLFLRCWGGPGMPLAPRIPESSFWGGEIDLAQDLNATFPPRLDTGPLALCLSFGTTAQPDPVALCWGLNLVPGRPTVTLDDAINRFVQSSEVAVTLAPVSHDETAIDAAGTLTCAHAVVEGADTAVVCWGEDPIEGTLVDGSPVIDKPVADFAVANQLLCHIESDEPGGIICRGKPDPDENFTFGSQPLPSFDLEFDWRDLKLTNAPEICARRNAPTGVSDTVVCRSGLTEVRVRSFEPIGSHYVALPNDGFCAVRKETLSQLVCHGVNEWPGATIEPDTVDPRR